MPLCHRQTRRAATLEEKRAHKETRQGTCYWVDVVITKQAQTAALDGAPAPTSSSDYAPSTSTKRPSGMAGPSASKKAKKSPATGIVAGKQRPIVVD